MKKIDWVRKLTSRKFWLSIASFVAMLMVALGQPEATATQVTSLIMAGATVIGYVIGEGLADYRAGDHTTKESGDGSGRKNRRQTTLPVRKAVLRRVR